MGINLFLVKNAMGIVLKMNDEFDTHKFIIQLIKDFEKEYVELLYFYKDNSGIFRTLHSNIGKYLSLNSKKLSIRKIRKESSENIKDYDSENQKWRKL